MLRIAALSILVISLAGCAGRLSYTGPATQPPLALDKTIQQPYEQAWARTLKTFQDRAYTVASADKATGLIQLRVAGDPQPYLDCGQVESMAATLRAKIRRVYQFPAAAAHTSYEQLMRGNIYDVLRDMHMDSLVDVQLRSAGRRQTHATVSSHYQLTRTVHISNATHKTYEPISDTIAFTTLSKGRFPGANTATECVATGQLERKILGLIS